MTERISREIRLRARPAGMPRESDFELAETRVPAPGDGQVLVRVIYMSVDPYMRGRMVDRRSYVPPFQLGEPLSGSCVGEVVDSRDPGLRAGDHVHGELGWREYFLAEAAHLRRVDPRVAPLRAHLSVLGLTSLTAYVGMLDIARPRPGDTVFVSAAAGAVGQIACQIAKLQGCRVVGSAGSAQKLQWLREQAGLDAAFDYHGTDLARAIATHCPDGLDVYFDNVGGDHLEAALKRMNPFGRVVMCGMISQYNATEATPAPRNLANVIAKRLTLRGLIVTDHLDRLPEFQAAMATWIAQGRITWTETLVTGLERAPRAFIDLFEGRNTGKMIVQVGPDPSA
jgi:NADPH-dependent curcumin reductase CurA